MDRLDPTHKDWSFMEKRSSLVRNVKIKPKEVLQNYILGNKEALSSLD
jgi:hypothetical protein